MVLVWLLAGALLLVNLVYCVIQIRGNFRQARRDIAVLGMIAAAGAVLGLFAVERAGTWAMAAEVARAMENF